MEELKTIMQKFAASGWDLIADPAREWLDGKSNKDTLVISNQTGGWKNVGTADVSWISCIKEH